MQPKSFIGLFNVQVHLQLNRDAAVLTSAARMKTTILMPSLLLFSCRRICWRSASLGSGYDPCWSRAIAAVAFNVSLMWVHNKSIVLLLLNNLSRISGGRGIIPAFSQFDDDNINAFFPSPLEEFSEVGLLLALAMTPVEAVPQKQRHFNHMSLLWGHGKSMHCPDTLEEFVQCWNF